MAAFLPIPWSSGDPSETAQKILFYVLLVVSLTFHEYGHAWSAKKLGDDTADLMGRLTLNPLVHLDPLFTVALPLYFLFYGGASGIFFCAAKPVPVNPWNMRKPTRDMMITSAAGPAMNVLLALFFTAAYWFHTEVRHIDPMRYSSIVIIKAIQLNLGLAIFNMLPIPPLDGHRVLGYFLPSQLRERYYRIGGYGFLVLIVMMSTGVLSRLTMAVFEPVDAVWSMLMPGGMSIFGW